MKKITYIIPLIICIFTTSFFVNKEEKYFTPENDLISRQEVVNEQIKKYLKEEINTIDNPKIINNPYEISPLTSLIIFKTPTLTQISIFLNNELINTITEKEFLIPVVNLIENYNNKIDLVTNNKKYTKKSTIYTILPEKRRILDMIKC